MGYTVKPAGEYAPTVRFGDQIFVAGMTPRVDNALVATGRVGEDVGVEQACGLVAIAARRAIAAIEERKDVGGAHFVPLSLTVFVCASPGFAAYSTVADRASQVVAEWSGGLLPTRATIGVYGLPGGAPVEVSLVVGVDSQTPS